MPAPKLSKGQLLYREKPVRGRDWTLPLQREVEAVVVDTVGSKYFTIAEDPDYRYLKATLRDEYAHCPRLHQSAQEITDEWEREKLQRDLSEVFAYYPVPLPLLHQVAALVAVQLAASRQPLPPQ